MQTEEYVVKRRLDNLKKETERQAAERVPVHELR